MINGPKRRNPPCAAPPLSSFPMGKKLDTTQRGASQGGFLLLGLFISYITDLSQKLLSLGSILSMKGIILKSFCKTAIFSGQLSRLVHFRIPSKKYSDRLKTVA